MKLGRGRRGFTLLEVLIVVAIIIIIAGIATPRFTGIAERGKAARAAGDLRVLQTAIESYILHTNILPTSANVASNLESADPNIVTDYDDFVDPFTTNAAAYAYKSTTSGTQKLYFFASVGKNGTLNTSFSGATVTNTTADIVVTNAKKAS